MPQQLIYTSAQRGLVAGRSGHCTVARSSAMREALMLQLEKLSYYQHLSLSGGQERQIYSCRVLDIRGSRFHVLSRIQDVGLDFTNRTNFLAHHLVFTPEEIRQFASAPVILRSWSGWVKIWNQEPQMLENEDWSGLAKISGVVSVPATTWQQMTGDGVNGYGLLDSRSGIAFRVDNLSEDQILALFAESLELLELRDPRRDFRVTSWQYTFTTSMQEQDNPADFRWRCLHSDNPVSNRSAGPDCRQLSEVRAQRVTNEEKMFAQSGRQPPRIVTQPQNVRVTEGEPARFRALAEGVPSPNYQWYSVDQAGNGQIIANGTAAELVLPNPPFGVSRYVVRASNSQGEVTSEVAKLESEKKLRISQPQPDEVKRVVPKTTSPSYVRSADDIEKQRRRIEADKAQEQFQKKLRRNKILMFCGIIITAIALVAIFIWKQHQSNRGPSVTTPTNSIALVESPTTNSQATVSPASNPPAQLSIAKAPTNILEPNSQSKPKEPQPSFGFGLPDGWAAMFVGSVTNYRYECIDLKRPYRFDLKAAALGFLTNADNLLFVSKTNSGMEFRATLLKVTANSPLCRNGIMIRESEKPDSAFLFIGASSQKVVLCRRDSKGIFVSQEADYPGANENSSIMLKFDQNGGKYSAAYSIDFKNWLQFQDQDLVLPANAQTRVGFAQSSGNTAETVRAIMVELLPTR
jgi:hypothetical protein